MSTVGRRVKLYFLNEETQEWDDQGTGHISTFITDEYDGQGNGHTIEIRSEENGQILLEASILPDTEYKKENTNIIIWHYGNTQIAVSFETAVCCSEMWSKIAEVQSGHEDYNEDERFTIDEINDPEMPIELPPCELSRLEEIQDIIQLSLSSQQAKESREKLSTAIENESYINKLIDLFRLCEDLENIDGLHALFNIFKGLLMLEKNTLFEIMFNAENIMDIIGILEYDPSKKDPTLHREFLNGKADFKEVVPISNSELVEKIHQTYRVQYIKDILVPVPSLFDDTHSTLSAFLFFNKIKIVQLIQEDAHFLEELFERLTDAEVSNEKRKDIVLLLKELCNYSQPLQNENRDMFITTLAQHGLLESLEQLMNIEDSTMRTAIVDIIYCVVELNPAYLRLFFCKEAETLEEDSMLLNMLINLLVKNSDNGMGVTLYQLLRTLLDTENMGLGPHKSEKSEFLNYFYRHSVHFLIAPLLSATTTNELLGKDDYERATVLDHIVGILTFCVGIHNYVIKTFIVAKDMLRRVLLLLQSKHKFLALSSLRFCRKIIGLKDDFLNRYIMTGKLFNPIVQAFTCNGSRYNLLNSAIIELFDFMHKENMKALCSFVVENHWEQFRDIGYVTTFAKFYRSYEQEEDRENNRESETPSGIIYNSAARKRDDRTLDEYEESYFEEDDELSSLIESSPSIVQSEEAESYLTKPISAKLKDVDLLDNNTPLQRTDSPPPGPRPLSPATGNLSETQKVRRPGSPNLAAARPNSPNGLPISASLAQTDKAKQISSESLKQTGPVSPNQDVNKTNNLTKQGNWSPVNNSPITKNNNKPIIQLKIKNTGLSKQNHLDNLEKQHNTNGVLQSETKSNSMSSELTNHVNNVLNHKHGDVIVKKTLLKGLVDYPDDDDDDEEHGEGIDDIPSSPAKKQRIEST